jgi:hypothetical protein
MRIKRARITQRAEWVSLLRTPGWPPRKAMERARERRARAREKESKQVRKHVAPNRVFGGNIGAEREQLGYRTCQSECTRTHEERLALLVPAFPTFRASMSLLFPCCTSQKTPIRALFTREMDWFGGYLREYTEVVGDSHWQGSQQKEKCNAFQQCQATSCVFPSRPPPPPAASPPHEPHGSSRWWVLLPWFPDPATLLLTTSII